MPLARAIRSAVQWVVSTGGSASVSATTRATERRDARGPRLVVQEAVDAFLHEPFLPAPDASLRLAGPAHDLVGADTVGAQEDDRRPPIVFLRGVTVPGDRFKSVADGPRDRDGNSGAHAPDSHGNRNRGIPNQDSSVRQRPLV
jgi:hypothetical protein